MCAFFHLKHWRARNNAQVFALMLVVLKVDGLSRTRYVFSVYVMFKWCCNVTLHLCLTLATGIDTMTLSPKPLNP